MDKQAIAARDLVHTMMKATGLTATELARAAGLVPSTLTRFLNSPVKHTLSARTISKLATASAMPIASVASALGLNDSKGAPGSPGVDFAPDSIEYVQRAKLWRSWCALDQSQQYTIASAISVMILGNENRISHGTGPYVKKGSSH